MLQQNQDDSSCRLEYFLTAFEYLNAVVAHAGDAVGHGEGEGVLAALAGMPAEHGGGVGIGVGGEELAVAQQGEVDVGALAAAVGEEGVVFAGMQGQLAGHGSALCKAACEQRVLPGAAVFFAHGVAVHALRLRQPVVGRGLNGGGKQQDGQENGEAAGNSEHGVAGLRKWFAGGRERRQAT